MQSVRFLDAGEQALVVEFGDGIDPALNAMVHAFDAALQEAAIPGLQETLPTYRSVLVHFDPATIDRVALRARLRELAGLAASGRFHPARRWLVPVAYGGAAGMDLDDVARALELSTAEVVRLHAGAEYVVYMLGFSPGFPYLGGLPQRLHLTRRAEPRLRTPARSVIIGGQQAAILPGEMPSGWHVLGRTPVHSFDLRRAEPFLFRPGDLLRFEPVSEAELARLEARTDWLPPVERLA
ncbi:MAG: 5-oxoprolinase subunit PxpB [Alphaproteobacteria bacterium]|nr:5-oxoprolinase subunit PxpB [Alphaproteobacteria bacterium]